MMDHGHDNVKARGGVAVMASVPASPVRATATIGGFAFAPQQVAVTVGATITFATTGAHEHDCSVRLLMVGTIVVEAAAESDFPR